MGWTCARHSNTLRPEQLTLLYETLQHKTDPKKLVLTSADEDELIHESNVAASTMTSKSSERRLGCTTFIAIQCWALRGYRL